ncbi:hypothetical protein [Dyadobacter pollutisoli]|uniref:Uncharacterized protein n=1 Tax=Dyadobacter pollutisoli TaxID=2910158 RepID=A0A9E8SQV0_9BACT|nr:hypothetical protein [Dyadobacter pollutisoli]WAC13457.1 hypothetical protein ON006_05760 [Dyadobacter pollutisoli]
MATLLCLSGGLLTFNDTERKKVMTDGADAVSKENLIDLDIAVRAFALSMH